MRPVRYGAASAPADGSMDAGRWLPDLRRDRDLPVEYISCLPMDHGRPSAGHLEATAATHFHYLLYGLLIMKTESEGRGEGREEGGGGMEISNRGLHSSISIPSEGYNLVR